MQARLVCRDFCAVLEQESIWREARQLTYGDLLPASPHEVSEIQLAKLLVGRGCQIEKCTQMGTKKIYWPWMIRLCEQCLSDSTRGPDHEGEEATRYAELRDQLELEVQETIPKHLTSLIPSVSQWLGKYTSTRPFSLLEQMWRSQGISDNYLVRKDDLEELKTDFRRKVMTDPSYFLFWARLRWGSTKTRVAAAMDMEWHEGLNDMFSPKTDKAEFFKEMATTMSPPMCEPVLHRMLAYHRAVETSNSASLRAWDGLKAKIDHVELREQALQLIEWEREAVEWRISAGEGPYDRVAEHRRKKLDEETADKPFAGYPPEMRFVLNIAEREVVQLLDHVHDEDVLLMLLTRVRSNYETVYKKPDGLNGDGVEGPYRLLLDDARKIVTDVLTPLVANKGAVRARQILNSLRCMACTRPDCTRGFSFVTLMLHIRKKHSIRVGKGLHYWQLAVPVQSRMQRWKDGLAWHKIPWPKALPALPNHRTSRTDLQWNPEQPIEYIQHPDQHDFRLFDNLLPVVPNDLLTDKNEEPFVHAMSVLSGSRLEATCAFRVALEYAEQILSQKFMLGDGNPPCELGLTQLQNLQKAFCKIPSGYEFRFKCALCMNSTTKTPSGRRSREIIYTQPLSLLMKHWKKQHKSMKDVDDLKDLIHLPSDTELTKAIQSEDEKLTNEKRRATQINLSLNPVLPDKAYDGRSNDPRADATLKIPMIRDRVSMLFTPVEISDTEEDSEEVSHCEAEE